MVPGAPTGGDDATRRRATRCGTPRFAHWILVCETA
ncbi:hypothetical protein MT3573.10 [Mycobacterium tuberculosis CDC1551]|uniref:Uncharacterized protein n=1 Tax=Mycobacterium tuberculosis (strain CDC 1551 / Oshkosh) TaxID=83331 RepID=Q8VJ01_MYCTO|nr:hypothetical protein MT3573.10 [Mycobacterium tuberculosis CDC1551]